MLKVYGTMDWFQIGKGVHQGCILSPCLFNLYAEYIVWSSTLDEAQLESRLQGEVSITWDMQISQFSSVAQLCLTLCNPIDCNMRGFPVHHQCPEPTQTHVHHVGDAIQPSHPLSSPFPLTFNLSQHQGLFQWLSSSHQVAIVLEHKHQYQSFQWIFRTDFLMDWLAWSPCSLWDSQTPQFKSINSSVLIFLYSPTLTSIHDY